MPDGPDARHRLVEGRDAGQAGVDGHRDARAGPPARRAGAGPQLEVEGWPRGHPGGLGQQGRAAGGRRRPRSGRRRATVAAARRPPPADADDRPQGRRPSGQRTPVRDRDRRSRPDGTQSHPDDRGGPVPDGHAGPGVAAAGAQAASFPIHFGRQPTPVALPSAACSPSDCNRWWRPPPTSPTASGRPVTPSTWWGARSATPSWPEPGADAADGRTGPRLHHRRPARRHRGGGVRLGRRGLDPGQAVRHHRVPPGRPEVRDHHPPGRGLPARLPQARRGLRRPGRGRPGPAGLHRQRHGPPPARARAHRSLRRPGRPGRPPAAHPARPRGLLRRRPAAHAPGRPVHRQARPRARPGAGRGGPGRPSTACPSSRPSGSATSWTRS